MLNFTSYASSSHGNLYTVDNGHSRVLIEMGLPIREIRKALGFNLSEVSFALLTHEHQDHARAVADVLRAGVDVYMSSGTAEALKISGHHRVHIVKALQATRVGTWTIFPVEAVHDTEEPLAFLLANGAGERLLFAVDTAYLKNRFADLNVITIACNYEKGLLDKAIEEDRTAPELRHRLIHSHAELQTVKSFLKANNLRQAREIHLLHLSRDNSDAERFRKEVMQVTGKPTYVAPE